MSILYRLFMIVELHWAIVNTLTITNTYYQYHRDDVPYELEVLS